MAKELRFRLGKAASDAWAPYKGVKAVIPGAITALLFLGYEALASLLKEPAGFLPNSTVAKWALIPIVLWFLVWPVIVAYRVRVALSKPQIPEPDRQMILALKIIASKAADQYINFFPRLSKNDPDVLAKLQEAYAGLKHYKGIYVTADALLRSLWVVKLTFKNGTVAEAEEALEKANPELAYQRFVEECDRVMPLVDPPSSKVSEQSRPS